jgi:signal transduction histidine kinase
MTAACYRRQCVRRFLPVVLLASIAGTSEAVHASHRQKQVLVLYSSRRDSHIAKVGDRELPRILESTLKQTVDYYSEFMDVPRFQDDEYDRAFRDYLALKYKGQRFDVIIAMSPSILEFLVRHHSELVHETPIVFFQTSSVFLRPANSTGIIAEPSFSGTIDLARKLQPDLQHVFVVIGGGKEWEGIASERMVRQQLAPLESQFTVTYLSGVATTDLEKHLSALPAHSIVFYIAVNRDATGQYFNSLQYIDRVVAVANAPTYSWVDSTLGHGVVGGTLKVQENETAAIAHLAVRVLRGEPADRIAPPHADLNVAQVDWRELRRWGISEARIPAGTLVRFREPSTWDRYHNYILVAVGLLGAQSALIALLLVQGVRRREAEEQVRGSQAKLRASYDRIRDMAGRLLMAQEDERTRIARELHDDVGQQLALLTVDLDLVRGAGGEFEAETGTLLDDTLKRAREIAKTVHDLSHRLHPEKLHLLGLVAGLTAIQREFSLPSLKVRFEHRNVPALLPRNVTLCLFRIAQEALQNIVKHSSAHDVSIELVGTDRELTLTIVDDGTGFDEDTMTSKGLGLISMGERLEGVGGSLNIRSRPGAGTRLEIAVPHERLVMSPA